MTEAKRPAPAKENRPSPNSTTGTEFTSLPGLQRHEPLTRQDRDDLDLLIKAAERGFRLSVKCVDCGHPLTAPSSVRQHRGPKCAAKAVE
jgi:Family of unknown function (DUF6011)